MRRLRRTPLGSTITAVSLSVALVTSGVVFLYLSLVAGDSVQGSDIALAVLLALAVALGIGLYCAQIVTQRVRTIEEAARKVAEGEFGSRIQVDYSGQLGQLARTFNEMQRRLAELDSARKQFIANASHELRTPIFSLGGFIELLEEDEPSPEERDEFVRTMRQQVERLTKLTSDLLNLTQLDAGGILIDPDDIDISDLAREVVREFGPRADLRGSRLELRTPDVQVTARADPERARQIIRILLDNALTHTPEGASVTVTTYSVNGRAEVTVSDDGPGIPRRLQGRLFERFYTAAASGGSGLGLAIARELAQRMDGRITVASSKRFTAFTLDLPPASPAGIASASSPARVAV